MAAENKNPEAKPKRAPTLYIIAAIKLGKGLLLLLAAMGIFSLAGKDLSDAFDSLLRKLHLDPEWRFFASVGDWLGTITPANLQFIASSTMLFGGFLLIVGLGLMLRFRWAIWLCIGESAFFIPIEIYELVRHHASEPETHHLFAHPKVALAILLTVNVAIVWYLYQNRTRLFRHHH